MSDVSFYHFDDDGRIVTTGACPENQYQYQQIDGYHLGQGVASLTDDYYDHADEQIKPRPSMSLTGGDPVAVGELWRIDGIPAGTEVVYPGGTVVVDDGYIELAFADPGEYTFKLSNFPYLEDERIATITSV